MADKPTREFGKRRPAPVPAAPPVKRSGHVALLLMGTLAVGGSAFALMPRATCEPTGPGMAAPDCAARGSTSSGGHGGGWSSRSSFFSGGSQASPSPGTAAEAGSGVTRGGFGSFARAFTAHFSGGG